MRDVFIVGVGQTPVGEHWGQGLRELGAAAIHAAMDDAGFERVDALYAGNMMGGCLNGQENVATLLADAARLLAEVVEQTSLEGRTDQGLIKEKLRAELRRFIRKRSGRRPFVLPVIMEI